MCYQNYLRGVVLAASVLLMAGCANNTSKPANDTSKGSATTSASATANGSSAAQSAQTPPPVVVIPNPSMVTFEKMSAILDSNAKATIAQLSEKAESSKKLLITGFCDQKQIGNAKDSAIARAVAVRKELQAHGVKTPNRSEERRVGKECR